MIELFTPKRNSPDCPFKGTQRLVKISILTPRCACSLTPRYDVHRWVWLRGGMHTAELFKNSNTSGKSVNKLENLVTTEVLSPFSKVFLPSSLIWYGVFRNLLIPVQEGTRGMVVSNRWTEYNVTCNAAMCVRGCALCKNWNKNYSLLVKSFQLSGAVWCTGVDATLLYLRHDNDVSWAGRYYVRMYMHKLHRIQPHVCTVQYVFIQCEKI